MRLKPTKYLVSSSFVCMALAGTLAAPARAQTPTPEVLRIYASAPKPGASGIANAMLLAFEQQAKSGLICGGKFKLDYRPLESAATNSAELVNANKVVADPDAMLIVAGLDSDALKAVLPVFNRAGLAAISPSATYPGLTKAGGKGEPQVYQPSGQPTLVRVIPADDVQGDAGAKWAKSMGVKRFYILHDTTTYGQGVADSFRATAKAIKLEELGYEGLDTSAKTFSTLVAKIKTANPQLIYVGGAAQSQIGPLIQTLRTAGLTETLVMGTEGWVNKDLARALGESATRVFATAPGLTTDKLPSRGKQVLADYQKRFNAAPDAYTLYGYEAVSLAVRTLATTCKKDRAAIRTALFGIKNFNGVLGTWAFDANGDITLKAIKGYRLLKGQWQEAGPLNFK